jgi:hypothetical protein
MEQDSLRERVKQMNVVAYQRATTFETSLEYAAEKLRRAIENIADAANVAPTPQQFRLSLLKIKLEAVIRELQEERT